MKIKCLKWWHFWGDYFSYDNLLRPQKNILEIGSGRSKTPGVVTIDINASVNPDILHDLNIFPWPVPDSSFDAVVMFSVIEHLSQPLRVLEECHRILRPHGRIYMLTPHFSDSASYLDPTHKWHFSGRSFDYLIEGTSIHRDYGFYSPVRFKLVRRLVSLKGLLDKVPFAQWLVNNYLAFWEDYLCFLVRGAGIYMELEKIETESVESA